MTAVQESADVKERAEQVGSGQVVVTGVGFALPGVDEPGEVERGRDAAAEPVDPAAHLGKKGLRYKDHATRLALVAAKAALVRSGLWNETDGLTVDPRDVAVLASSNLGNLDSVAEVAALIGREGGTRLVSPIATPNLSSNVVCADIAIRFGLRGPNMMVCNGATSGLDALRWAATWLRSGRARHALVVGVEPDNDVSRAYAGGQVLDGAVAVVIERDDSTAGRPVLGELGPVARSGRLDDSVAAAGGTDAGSRVWFVPEGDGMSSVVLPEAERVDVSRGWGRTSGAHGLLQIAVGTAHLAGGASSVVATCGGPADDAIASVVLRAPRSEPCPA
jgi:3-oxoacyl-[acyl-carrier-protein] synthase II